MPGTSLSTAGASRISTPGTALTTAFTTSLVSAGTGEQVKTVRVTETVSINLLFVPPVKAAGLTERELEGAVSKAYEDARLIHDARRVGAGAGDVAK